jgi:hypothetical protein
MTQAVTSNHLELRASTGAWLLRMATDQPAVIHLGLDTEGTGREVHNLLREPLCLSWMQSTAPLRSWSVEQLDDGHIRIRHQIDYGTIDWDIKAEGDSLLFEIRQEAWAPVYDLTLAFNLSQQYCPTAVLPHAVEDDTRLQPPWLFVAPDHGHLYGEVLPHEGPRTIIGKRTPSQRFASVPWYSTLAGQRGSHTLVWTLRAAKPYEKGDTSVLRFSPQSITKPDAIDEQLWQRIRRPWLNQFQPNADENDVETPMMLANNVLSNPAICCTAYYSDSMLYTPEPLPGINLALFVRRTLDDWFQNRAMGLGNIAAFGKHDLYLFTNPMVILAAWDYLQMTQDLDWLRANIWHLQTIAAYILRRDQDQDGIAESIQSGNAWSLRDPDRADFYLESINFGYKNAITNAIAYRAYHCMVDLLTMLEHTKAAAVFSRAADRLKQAYVPTFYNSETGVLAGWVSQDGKVHDYIFPFVNGLACAYGLVEKPLGREILGRIMARLREMKPEGWRWGVPVNLLPVPDFDLMQPAFTVDFTGGIADTAHGALPIEFDELGLPRFNDPTGELSFRGKALYNGATQTMLTSYLLMGLLVMDMPDDADWIFNPMLEAAEAGELQNGLHVTNCTGAEHHDWEGNPTGYEGYLPEGWCFLMTALMRNRAGYRKLLPYVFVERG